MASIVRLTRNKIFYLNQATKLFLTPLFVCTNSNTNFIHSSLPIYNSNKFNQRSKTNNLLNKRNISLTSTSLAKIVQFNLSDIGEGIREVSVKEWFVKEGDKVNQFDSICEVQSDKASVTITSRFDGVIKKLYYQIDDTALVGEPLVDIELGDGVEVTEEITKEVEKQPLISSSSSVDDSPSFSFSSENEKKVPETSKVLATPAVRNLAASNKVNLSEVLGSGKHGRILKDDIIAFMNQKEAPQQMQPRFEQIIGEEPKPISRFSTVGGTSDDKSQPVTGLMKAMVKSMTAACQVPHFCYCDEISMTKMVGLRDKFKGLARKYGVKYSYTSVFIKAASLAIAEFPIINSQLDENAQNLIYKGSHNIGIAVDSPSGLIVPNIKNVQNLSVLGIAVELNRLINLASQAKLTANDLSGGTFTLSNVGMIGGTYLKPILFVPQVVIGALGSISKVARFDDKDQMFMSHIMNVSWSADHRVIDGATLARFSNAWKEYVENPETLLLQLR